MKSPVVAAAVLDSGKHDDLGLRLATREEREAIVGAFRSSGMTQRAFAAREGVKYHTFAHWLREARIKSGEHVVRPRRTRFIELGTRPMGNGFSLEVAFPDGMVVRGSNSEEVAALARALR